MTGGPGSDRPDRWGRIESLFAAARGDAPASVDVTRAVMARIARGEQPATPLVDRTLAWCALGSVAAAGIVAMLAGGAFSDPLDPLTELMTSCDVVLR